MYWECKDFDNKNIKFLKYLKQNYLIFSSVYLPRGVAVLGFKFISPSKKKTILKGFLGILLYFL